MIRFDERSEVNDPVLDKFHAALHRLRAYDKRQAEARKAEKELDAAIRSYAKVSGHICGMSKDAFRRTVANYMDRERREKWG